MTKRSSGSLICYPLLTKWFYMKTLWVHVDQHWLHSSIPSSMLLHQVYQINDTMFAWRYVICQANANASKRRNYTLVGNSLGAQTSRVVLATAFDCDANCRHALVTRAKATMMCSVCDVKHTCCCLAQSLHFTLVRCCARSMHINMLVGI